MNRPLVGVLALQGDFARHQEALERAGCPNVRLVRTRAQLEGLDGLILPGGESSTILKLLRIEGLMEPLRQFPAPIFGTCAGMILLAREVSNPGQESLGLLDAHVRRNGYGAQRESFEAQEPSSLGSSPLPLVFIRAPWIEELAPESEVLCTSGGRPVLVRQGRVLAASFHPELTDDPTVHAYFLRMVAESMNGGL